MKSVLVLGSTGRLGQKILEVINNFRNDYRVIGLVAHKNYQLLIKQAKEFLPEKVILTDFDVYKNCKRELSGGIEVGYGEKEVKDMLWEYAPDITFCAISGSDALGYVIEALKLGKRVATANKESIVMAGHIILQHVKEYGAELIPVDSEHSAIFQILENVNKEQVLEVILTASGGPFFGKRKEEIMNCRAQDVLTHPVWDMGKRITVDSATMVNKGLEIVETKWLFDISHQKIKVLIHPEAIVHAMLKLCDGTIMATLGYPDMRLPVQYALTYPERAANIFSDVNLIPKSTLSFYEVGPLELPAIKLGYMVAEEGGTTGAVFNAANEEAVSYFLQDKIYFTEIVELIYKVMQRHKKIAEPTIEEIMEADRWAREEVRRLIKK